MTVSIDKTATKVYLDPSKKHDAILLFDCTDGNPNGDPDNNNQPRIDPETRQGLITDACLKRKVRNYVNLRARSMEAAEKIKYKLFVEDGSVLNEKIERGYIDSDSYTEGMKEGTPEQQSKVAEWMQANFFDLRMFGAVLSTGLKAGQVWGPIQITPARSIDPILPQSLSITRCARTNKEEGKENKTMGRKEMIPYGLYKTHIFYNHFLRPSCLNQLDLELFWEAVVRSFEFDRSAARGFMSARGLWIFSHDHKYGNAPVHQLFDRLSIETKNTPPRKFNDYNITFDETPVDGITITKLV